MIAAPALAPRGMVACPHALASSAGVDALRAGGSAVDAAIAAASTLAVIYPHMCGIGGDAFWLIYDAAKRSVSYLDGGGRAAKSATLDRFNGQTEIPFRGLAPATLTTPGAVASFCEAHARHGKLPLARCLEQAIHYARDGFPVSARLSRWIEQTAPELAPHAGSAAIFLPDGQPPRPGARIANPRLAETLAAIAAQGRAGYYEGEVAAKLAKLGGFFTTSDLAAQRARWGEPIRGTYRDVTIYETPAPTQGFTVLEMLNLVEPLHIADKGFQSVDHVHLLVQAKQIAYHDRDRALADPAFAKVPVERLISKSYADARRGLIDPSRALPWDKVPAESTGKGDTVSVSVVDADGNAASLIFSLYGVFGSCVTSPETGVVLQNRSAYFSLDPTHPNRLEPGKTPLHTLIASLAFRNDKLWAVLGCMGADGQPQIHLQAYVAMIDFGRDIQQAVADPRWLSGRFALGEARDTLNIEARFPKDTIDELARRGHPVNRWGDWNELAGHAHGITIDPETGMRAGGFDPRSDGAAIGY
ncbi:MAG TPA: gamma-glutamyltransferase [Burkholderiales bacterium]|nr:gamma-glutamyltransferase [Burkholderiales bacterium]